MFDQLSDKILSSIKKLSGRSKLTEENIDEAIKEIRLALLEADVNFKVVREFINRVKEKAIGTEIIKGVNSSQQFIKIVNDELVETLGGGTTQIDVRGNPGVILLVGLQGAGKTTTAAKLARHIRDKLSKKPGLVPCDVYRPAAIEQLKVLGRQEGVSVFDTQVGDDPSSIVERAKAWALREMVDVLIVDTAGRLQIDEKLMDELSQIKSILNPPEILLVADAMLGQQSVNVAEGFHSQVGLTGLILTKVDGDARGGAALSIKQATGVPIKFLGVGEKTDALEVFHPDRLASRILDRGDIVSLVEKAQDVIDKDLAEKTAKRMARNEFTIEDFLAQMQQMKKLGPMENILKMMPGMGQAMKLMKGMAPPEKEMKRMEAIIQSMTPTERANHKILNGSRRLRIAKGSGNQVSDVNKFIRQFETMKKMMSQVMKMGFGRGGMPGGMPGGMKFPF
jgi:signal recognition particle subunit SRP54